MPYLAWNALVTSKGHFKSEELSQIINKVLQGPVILVTLASQTFINVIPDLSDFFDIFLEINDGQISS